MADVRNRVLRGPVALRIESGTLLSGYEVGARIENFVRTPEDTLRAIVGYCPYVPDPTKDDTAPGSLAHPHIDTTIEDLSYGPMFGVFHTILGNGREILLVHTGNQIWEHAGWSPARWVPIVGPSGISPLFVFTLDHDGRPRWPTQFVATPQGVVILPYEGRPLFYDGEVCAPLGYDKAPGAPNGRGPRQASARTNATIADVNQVGYAHDGNPKYPWYKASASDPQTQVFPDFGHGRLGSVKVDDTASPDGHAGAIDASLYEAAVQWVDRWGNLSPVSPRSPSLSWPAQSAKYTVLSNPVQHRQELLLKQVLWTGIEPGPDATVGRILLRTKDTLHSGTQKLFEVPSYASGGGAGVFATMPDNESTLYPDNTPDAWLLREAQDIAPVGRFRLGCLAFGRLWLANEPGNPGLVRYSIAGRWGTFLASDYLYPDPAREVTGLLPYQGGLLIFTTRGTYRVEMSDDAQFFRTSPLSTQIGCIAPSSAQTMPDGTAVWLSIDGFQGLLPDGSMGQVGEMIFSDTILTETWAQGACAAYDRTSGEYRCWVPTKGSTANDRCFIFDGEGWRRRTDMLDVRAVCVTDDARHYMIAVGTARAGVAEGEEKYGVWLLDHATVGFDLSVGGADVPPTIESSWIEAMSSYERVTVPRARWWLREASNSEGSVLSYRDWRKVASVDDEGGAAVPLQPLDDPYSLVWGVAEYDAADTYWTTRRPFWAVTDVYLPSVEVGRVVFSADWETQPEFIGVIFEAEGKRDGGTRSSRSTQPSRGIVGTGGNE